MDEADTTPETPPRNPLLWAGVGVALLLASVFLGRGAEPGLLVYVGRTLFVAGFISVAVAVGIWYRQAQRPEKERDPEV